ncbi:MAG: hypothetical protein JRF33_27785 [Deltaproteobacteria bacterium]|nr:hypothetical protein [Deltaproteobacteria bacterium]
MGQMQSVCEKNPSRYDVMLDVAMQTLAHDPELKLCEGLRLIEATRRSVARHSPSSLDIFESRVLPRMRETLMHRFGMVICPDCDIH